nr:MAG TPA: hypothetical protein [Bacteriophage sp.]
MNLSLFLIKALMILMQLYLQTMLKVVRLVLSIS